MLLLLTASLAASIGAANIFGSSSYNTDNSARTAHSALTIAAALGWSALVILIIILIVGWVAGGFKSSEVSDAILNKSSPTQEDLLAAIKGEKSLSTGNTIQIIIIIVLIIVAIITLIVGIFGAIGSVQIANILNRDQKASNAYTAAIVTAVSGVGGIAVMIVTIISYFAIRSSRKRQKEKVLAFERKFSSPPPLPPRPQPSITTPPDVESPRLTKEKVTIPYEIQSNVDSILSSASSTSSLNIDNISKTATNAKVKAQELADSLPANLRSALLDNPSTQKLVNRISNLNIPDSLSRTIFSTAK